MYGVDIDVNAIKHATDKYKSLKLEYIHGNTSEIPLQDGSIDVVVSFETIEHHDQHDKMMHEIKRVLRKDGLLIISSPEKTIYKERDNSNPFHVKELSLQDLQNLLSKYFSYTNFLNQRYIAGSLISSDNCIGTFTVFSGNYTCINNYLPEHATFYNRPFFNLAICSDRTIEKKLCTSFFDGSNDIIAEIERKEKKLRSILDSDEYKLGKFILKHFRFLRKFTALKRRPK